MDTLTFVKPRQQKKNKYPTLRVNDTMFEIISKISTQTGMSKAAVANKMIAFAATHTTVENCCAIQNDACCRAC